MESELNVNKAQGNSESPFYSFFFFKKKEINTGIPNAANRVPGRSRTIRVKVGTCARALSEVCEGGTAPRQAPVASSIP